MNKNLDRELLADVAERLINHLQSRTDVQNIDLMNLSGFCRNCLSKWYLAAAEKRNQTKRNEKSSTGTPTRDQLTVSSAQFWKKMTEKLAGGNVSQAQAMQIVNQFKLLQTDYVSSMSLEDIEDMAKNV